MLFPWLFIKSAEWIQKTSIYCIISDSKLPIQSNGIFIILFSFAHVFEFFRPISGLFKLNTWIYEAWIFFFTWTSMSLTWTYPHFTDRVSIFLLIYQLLIHKYMCICMTTYVNNLAFLPRCCNRFYTGAGFTLVKTLELTLQKRIHQNIITSSITHKLIQLKK